MICNSETKPNFKKPRNEANMMLISSGEVYSFPFSIKNLIKEKTNIKIKDYDKAATYGVEINDFGTEDAIIFKQNRRYIIFYNNRVLSKQRKVFSISHELGHYKMGHNLADKNNYDLYEVEANFFAAQLLMPDQVIFELVRRGKMITIENLTKWFRVSKEAANKRIETLNKINLDFRTMEEKEIDDIVLNKFKGFVDTIAPLNYGYSNPYEEEEEQNERYSWL